MSASGRKFLLRASRGTRAQLIGAMLVAVAVVVVLASWDEARESEHALEDFALEQATLASSLSSGVRARLGIIRRDALIAADEVADGRRIPATITASYSPLLVRANTTPAPSALSGSPLLLSVPVGPDRAVDIGVAPSSLLLSASSVERPGELTLLLRPPGSDTFFTTDGREIRSAPLRTAFDAGLTSVRLARDDAASVGLFERTAFAGIARVEVESFGRWGIVAVASAKRLRDRERWARWRMALGVALAGGLVIVFGGIALRNLRAELDLERELAVSQARSERDERLARATRAAMMGTFAMGVTHEISTPLGVIAGRAEQLRSLASSDERAARAAQAILDQTERIKALVRAFLDLARGGPPTLKRVKAAAVARGAVSLTAHRFEKARVFLRVDVPDDLPVIPCDHALLEHAIVNLLLNACEASDPEGVVELTARTDGSHVAFVVTDSGSGITPDNVSRVTEPFFTTKTEGKGTGLGLAIATEIVKSHRGNLTIEPRAPRGTRAAIEIPVAPEEARHAA